MINSLRSFAFAILLFSSSIAAIAENTFFPPNSLSSQAKAEAILQNWFGKQLAAMGEAPLHAATSSKTVYRFTWLRSFHHPMTFRLETSDFGGGILVATENSGEGGFDPGKPLYSNIVELAPRDVRSFEEQISSFDFWAMPVYDESTHGFDGARWIFEGYSKGNYHVVHRQSPIGTEFANTMLRLMRLSGMELGEIY